jgi:glycine/D-amino acid oxidase-like deaminating enzyme
MPTFSRLALQGAPATKAPPATAKSPGQQDKSAWAIEVALDVETVHAVAPGANILLVTTPVADLVRHKVYDADYVGAVGSNDAALQTSSVVESTAAGTVLIGSSRERRGFDERIEARVLSAVAAKALVLFPFLADVAVMRAYGGFRPFVPDHLPVIGPDPRLPGLWHATGHEGAGIVLSTATGELLTDLLLNRPPHVDAAAFAVDRPTLLPHLTATRG